MEKNQSAEKNQSMSKKIKGFLDRKRRQYRLLTPAEKREIISRDILRTAARQREKVYGIRKRTAEETKPETEAPAENETEE